MINFALVSKHVVNIVGQFFIIVAPILISHQQPVYQLMWDDKLRQFSRLWLTAGSFLAHKKEKTMLRQRISLACALDKNCFSLNIFVRPDFAQNKIYLERGI